MRLDQTVDPQTTLQENSSGMIGCTVCGNKRLKPFFSIPELPVDVGRSFADESSALAAPMGNVELVFCHRCSHIFNRQFRSELITYAPGYEVALYHSPVFREFMKTVAQRLIDQFDLRNKTIFEIGAGRGWFLRLLCQLGANRGFGIDPAVPLSISCEQEVDHICIYRDYFDARFSERFRLIAPDFICCLSVFEHIPHPWHMLRELRTMIGSKPTSLYFEIFNAHAAFARTEVWSILYEQCSYFTPQSFAWAFQRAGFRIIQSGPCYQGDQYLFVEAATEGPPPQAVAEDDECGLDELTIPAALTQFTQAFADIQSSWQQRLGQFATAGKKVVFWGAGGKGVSFLNLLPAASVIRHVAESNPDKQGKYIPGSGQRIVAPQALVEIQPDVIILSNRLYEPEIRQQLETLGLRCDLLVA